MFVFVGCAAGRFGSDCSQRCNCSSRGVCDAVTGNCSCALGWTGQHCEKGKNHHWFKFSVNMICTHGFSSRHILHMVICVCVCIECPEDRFGPDCALECLCQNNSTCDRVSGVCQCKDGYYGHRCEHGERLSHTFTWSRSACLCSEMFCVCVSVCPAGLYGSQCSQRCDCVNDAQCHPSTGQCLCSAGFHGSRCDGGEQTQPALRVQTCCLEKANILLSRKLNWWHYFFK